MHGSHEIPVVFLFFCCLLQSSVFAALVVFVLLRFVTKYRTIGKYLHVTFHMDVSLVGVKTNRVTFGETGTGIKSRVKADDRMRQCCV